MHHEFNANWMYQLPVGKGKHFATHGLLDGVLGNWELTGIFRLTSGFPTTVADGNYWPTNWENSSNAILVGPKPASGTFMVNGSPESLSESSCGHQRLSVRLSRRIWRAEQHSRCRLLRDRYYGARKNLADNRVFRPEISWETFNITNAVRFDAAALEPIAGSNGGGNLSLTNSTGFGYYTATLTNPRVMQFALRYSF